MRLNAEVERRDKSKNGHSGRAFLRQLFGIFLNYSEILHKVRRRYCRP